MVRIFVGNLPYNTTDDELRQLFEKFGEVGSANVVMDRYTGRSRGFGFIEMPNDAEAQKAISDLNGSTLGDRNIAVSVARPREERPQGGGQDRGGWDRRDRGGRRDRR